MGNDHNAPPPAEAGARLVFRGGAAYGPNGQFGAWVVTFDAAGSVTLAGQSLGQEINRGPDPLSEAERTTLDARLSDASASAKPSERMGVPGETMLHFDFATPTGRHQVDLWHREALNRPPLAALLRFIDEVISARTGRFAAFGS